MFLGLDLGTTGLRGLLVDDTQTMVAICEVSCDTQRRRPGWSEQDPETWLTACKQVISTLKSQAPAGMAALQGIGLSGHMHGATVLDQNGTVLRPCILWNDTRSAAQAARIDSLSGVHETSGNIVFPGFTAPKLAWLAEHEPDIFKRVAKVLLPKDYVTYWLTGQYASDMSDASGTAWLDVAERDWSDLLLDASGMLPSQMPRLHEGSDAVGKLRPELATELGLPNGVVVAAGAADNAAAACGVGALNNGDGFISLGTSGVLLAARDRFAPNAQSAVHTFCHAVPEKWFQMGVILAATDSLNWLARNLQAKPAGLCNSLGDKIAAPGPTRFLPYLSGERTPHNDSQIRGAFLGIDIATGQDDLTRAVLEGVSFAIRDCSQALTTTGAQINSLIGIGGGTGSRYWVELLATLLKLPVERPAQGEFGAALGAARLAICAATAAPVSSVMHKPEIAETIDPRADLIDVFDEAYASYQTLYPGIKALQP